MTAEPRQNRRRSYQKSGIHALKRRLRDPKRALPSTQTALGRALRDWRESLIADLGGPDAISTQQLALVDMAVRSKLLVDSVDAYVLGMPSPVNKRNRCLYAVVKERQALVGQLQSILRDLGLTRRAKPLADLTAYLATKVDSAREPTAPRSRSCDAARGSSSPRESPRQPALPLDVGYVRRG